MPGSMKLRVEKLLAAIFLIHPKITLEIFTGNQSAYSLDKWKTKNAERKFSMRLIWRLSFTSVFLECLKLNRTGDTLCMWVVTGGRPGTSGQKPGDKIEDAPIKAIRFDDKTQQRTFFTVNLIRKFCNIPAHGPQNCEQLINEVELLMTQDITKVPINHLFLCHLGTIFLLITCALSAEITTEITIHVATYWSDGTSYHSDRNRRGHKTGVDSRGR